jgi:hypothetical protein
MSLNFIIDWTPYTMQYMGQEISMEIRPFKTWASILLTPIIYESSKIKSSDGASIEQMNLAYETQKIAIKILPEHIKNFNGITINGSNVTIEQLCDEAVFAPIVMDIIAEIAKRSHLTVEERKNSDEPSALPISDVKLPIL